MDRKANHRGQRGRIGLTVVGLVLFGFLCVLRGENRLTATATQAPDLALPQEKHLRNMRQLTFGGENAEAYFSSEGKKLIFQSTRDGHECDQIYTMNIDGSDVKLVSTGDGRTTCSYFFPGDKRILYSSTHLGARQCPPKPDFSKGYVWAVYDTFDIFTANPDGSDVKQLTDVAGYNAEKTLSRDGKQGFTSMRNGELDIYTIDPRRKEARCFTT